MNYSNIKEIQYHLDSLARDTVTGEFPSIDFGDFSIEASGGNVFFCDPQETFDKLTQYQTLQVTIFERVRGNRVLVSPNKDIRFQNLTWKEFFLYTNAMNRLTESFIGAKVPLNVVYKIIREVYKISHLKAFY
jgi:hypothetical protein